ncbi:MAG: helix-turn-helix domain-containing protein [Candidatus Limnocylindria bacterium]
MRQQSRDKWVTIREARERFGISRATIYRLIDSGQVARARRAGDIEAYVKVRDLQRATTLQVRRSTRR